MIMSTRMLDVLAGVVQQALDHTQDMLRWLLVFFVCQRKHMRAQAKKQPSPRLWRFCNTKLLHQYRTSCGIDNESEGGKATCVEEHALSIQVAQIEFSSLWIDSTLLLIDHNGQ